MYVQILANVTPTGTRVAVLEDGQLAEIYIERLDAKSLVGCIYKGRVSNVAAGMQAAFVDVGLEHDVFLPLGDVHKLPTGLNGTDGEGESDGELPVEGIEGEGATAGSPSELLSRPAPEVLSRNLGHGIFAGLRPGHGLKAGDEVVVQIVKEPIGTKGARGTLALTVPGRYLVLMPTTEHVGVSRKIDEEGERERLRLAVEEIRPPGIGLIIRTVAQGRDDEDCAADLRYLLRHWDEIQRKAEVLPVYSLLYKDANLIEKIVRDLFSEDVDEFIIDSAEEYEDIISVCSYLSPTLRERIKLYDEHEPLFERHNVEVEIDRALNKKVWLKSGGYLIIESTEALQSVDVNTGRYLGHDNLEQTVFQTNLEAAEVIARQIRLRNLAGIIVIDFIDMEVEEHKKQVMTRFKQAFKRDRIKTNILELTELGLVQMTRQRTRPTLNSMLKHECPYCHGEGRILSKEHLAGKIFREIQKVARKSPSAMVLVSAHPSVAQLLLETRKASVSDLEMRFKKKIYIRGEVDFHREEFRIDDNS